jgi:hypothetical protein
VDPAAYLRAGLGKSGADLGSGAGQRVGKVALERRLGDEAAPRSSGGCPNSSPR